MDESVKQPDLFDHGPADRIYIELTRHGDNDWRVWVNVRRRFHDHFDGGDRYERLTLAEAEAVASAVVHVALYGG